MSDSANVIAGSGKMYLAVPGTSIPDISISDIGLDGDTIFADFDPIGYTDDGVEFVYTPTFKDITVDEELSPVQTLLTAEKLEINVKMAETTLNNLSKAIAGSTLVVAAGVSTLSLGSPDSTKEFILGFAGPAPGSDGQRYVIVYRVKSKAAVTFKYQRKDKVIYTVKFEALADSSRDPGKRLCDIKDLNSAGS